MIIISYNTCWYVYNFRLPLIRAIKAAGHDICVLAPRDDYTERIIAEGVVFHDIRLIGYGTNPLRELLTIFAYWRIYKKLNPDMVLQYTIKPNLYGSLAARILGIPAVNNITGLGEAFSWSGLKALSIRLFYRFAFKRVARVFFQNEDDRNLFLSSRLVRTEQVDILPGSGVDTEYFAPLPRGNGAFTFLLIGRLLKAKGGEEFIGAARIVKAKHPHVRFAFLGHYDSADPKNIDPSLFADALESGLVEHWGEVEDVRPLIAKADCVVLPSYYREGIPRSLLEAASMAKPLVASNSIGTREPVVDGINGFLHQPRDKKNLAEKLLAILALGSAEYLAMCTASRAYMKERFEEIIVINKYLAILERYTPVRKNNK